MPRRAVTARPGQAVTRGRGRRLTGAAVGALSEVADAVPFCAASRLITDDLLAHGLIENNEPRLLREQRHTQAYVLTPRGREALRRHVVPLTGWRAHAAAGMHRLALLGGALRPVDRARWIAAGWLLELAGIATLAITTAVTPGSANLPPAVAVLAGVLLLGAGIAFSRAYARGRLMFLAGIPVAVVIAPIWTLIRIIPPW